MHVKFRNLLSLLHTGRCKSRSKRTVQSRCIMIMRNFHFPLKIVYFAKIALDFLPLIEIERVRMDATNQTTRLKAEKCFAVYKHHYKTYIILWVHIFAFGVFVNVYNTLLTSHTIHSKSNPSFIVLSPSIVSDKWKGKCKSNLSNLRLWSWFALVGVSIKKKE